MGRGEGGIGRSDREGRQEGGRDEEKRVRRGRRCCALGQDTGQVQLQVAEQMRFPLGFALYQCSTVLLLGSDPHLQPFLLSGPVSEGVSKAVSGLPSPGYPGAGWQNQPDQARARVSWE